jgi:hypothetical protein
VIKKSRTFDKIITNTPGWLITEVHGCMSMARWADGNFNYANRF